MSLLIEALKQAEAAQRQATTDTPANGAALQLEPVAPSLPEPPPASTPAGEPQAAPIAARSARTATRVPPREAVRELFEIKRAAPSRLPLMLAAGGLLILLAGGAYVWWATQPRGGMQVGPGLSSPARTETTPQPIAVPSTLPLPSTDISAGSADASAAPLSAQPSMKPVDRPHGSKAAADKPLQTPSPETPVVRRSPPSPIANEAASPIQQAYTAYTAGDLARARQGFLGILRSEPKNLDVLNALGLIALHSGRQAEAEHYYRQALVIDPKDATARSQLALLYGEGDPVTAETRLRSLLIEQPESAPALFALGSIYARQSRWSEAQQAFFQAHALDAANADTLYNLAVSLDHLNQPRLAQEYYERSAVAARRSQVAFDPAAARQRAAALQDASAATSKPASP
ncbi:tetratricopeptide repeat protein [Uliginosibacterium sp. 31-16]|uniref:tetratricopeptide repeat protein n=1 Tax=Uliginosibacterium sp. 31-16 TaxID=3068315 RepID=UPI00273F263B|nr:tetratricopeptide repeat protein [Uliginosibacterium sp. 31-16]MDP5241220.1 tetratricopeptide repeat protein [Uliginosibacterium sp. 31-16]